MRYRACLISALTTRGRLDAISVPFAKAINPISKTNWEGTGVEPDVKVSAADALSTAQKLAAATLAAKPCARLHRFGSVAVARWIYLRSNSWQAEQSIAYSRGISVPGLII